ncbi:hypothetical protein Hanom_Chr11g00987131 [Helianthus anomalus]
MDTEKCGDVVCRFKTTRPSPPPRGWPVGDDHGRFLVGPWQRTAQASFSTVVLIFRISIEIFIYIRVNYKFCPLCLSQISDAVLYL